MRLIRRILFIIVLLLFSVIFLYPLIYTVQNSLVDLSDLGKFVPLSRLTLDNYILLFTQYPVTRWFMNTLVVTICCVISQILVNTLAGYALARFDFPGKNAIFIIVLASMMIPFQFILTPVYIRLAQFKWNDHLISLIVPFIFQSLFVFMSRQFFLTIPKELEDAARVDGLGYAGTFFKIVLPISGPLITSITILAFTGTWNSYMAPSTFMMTRERFVLSVGLKTVRDFQFVKMNVTLAGVVLLSLPILVMFLCLQKHFMEGIATTGIKG
ncbi:MAG: carbohydrate ABC transporter permease [Lachnospiraceae bacterium]|jgi:multiple sugar transport system permease protein|nr:carbohydrate ABC transporter permease [Lachnospiraceae bacterium]